MSDEISHTHTRSYILTKLFVIFRGPNFINIDRKSCFKKQLIIE